LTFIKKLATGGMVLFLSACSSGPADQAASTKPAAPVSLDKATLTTVPTTEWNELLDRVAKLQAQNQLLREQREDEVQGATLKAKAECTQVAKAERESESARILKEVSGAIDVAQKRIEKYLKPSAIVNGVCRAELSDGKAYEYTLRNACLTIVNKKVNNDGEVSGLIGAVSAEAVSRGITKLDCDAGRSHIALIDKKCSTVLSSSVMERQKSASAGGGS
jgi:hypothetical protein